MELAEPEAATREALANAVAVARARGEALAAAAGLSLGEPIRIEEGGDADPAPFPRGAMMRLAADESAPTEVAAGEIEISASVRVWYALA
jgi:hypothetical protein